MSSHHEEVGNPPVAASRRWFNRNVLAIGLPSFLSDFSHETDQEMDAKEGYN